MHAADAIGSGQKTATGLGETGIDPRIETSLLENESRSDPKIATARGRTATERMTACDALDRLTANGKRSESENDGHGHDSCPTESELYDPSLFLDPKIGKHGRIEQGSGPSKLLSTHHDAERAVMSREKQPRKRRGQGESAATEQPPPPQLPKALKRQRRATDECPETLEREWRKPPGTQHQVHPETPPPTPTPLILPPEGREKEEEEVPGCGTSEEVPARGIASGAGGTEPEGRDRFRSL